MVSPVERLRHGDDEARARIEVPSSSAEIPHEHTHQPALAASGVQRLKHGPGALTPVGVLSLQRMIGNRGVSRILATSGSRPTAQRRTAVSPLGAIQRILSDTAIKERGEEIERRGASAPTAGSNLWLLTSPGGSAQTNLYIAGTKHNVTLDKMDKGKELVTFFSTTTFNEVYSELAENGNADATELLTAFEVLAREDTSFHEREVLSRKYAAAKKNDANRTIQAAGALDTVYVALASRGKGSKPLESREIRRAVRHQYEETSATNKVEEAHENNDGMEAMVRTGNERGAMQEHAKYLRRGIDPQDIEGRNQVWVQGVQPGTYHPGETIAWVVGASHLAGLLIELNGAGWQSTPVAL